MLLNRILISLLAGAALFTPPSNAFAADPGLSYGGWQFTRKDNEGVTWTGTLKIEKVDADRFNADKYNCECTIEAKGPKSSRGVGGPCTYDPKTRTLTLGGGRTDDYSYTAVLTPDGKALTQGRYSETVDELKNDDWVKVKKSGEWSAKLASK